MASRAISSTACRDGIEEILSSGYDGAHLEPGCARKAIEEFGIQRVELVLGKGLSPAAESPSQHTNQPPFSRASHTSWGEMPASSSTATDAMPREKQIKIAARLLAQARKGVTP